MKKLILLVTAAAAFALLAMPGAALAKRGDRNHDGIPDKWEKKFHLRGKGVAKADPDKDGLNNLAEFRSDTNPLKADSNANGVPDLRVLDKYAARMGGASNHRMRLDDGVLIKDNHVAVCGGVAEAVRRAKAGAGPTAREHAWRGL